MDEPPAIEHNIHEKRPTNALWWALWLLVGGLWVGTGFLIGFDWHQIALGAFTGMLLASWSIERTGNKVPESWTRRHRP